MNFLNKIGIFETKLWLLVGSPQPSNIMVPNIFYIVWILPLACHKNQGWLLQLHLLFFVVLRWRRVQHQQILNAIQGMHSPQVDTPNVFQYKPPIVSPCILGSQHGECSTREILIVHNNLPVVVVNPNHNSVSVALTLSQTHNCE